MMKKLLWSLLFTAIAAVSFIGTNIKENSKSMDENLINLSATKIAEAVDKPKERWYCCPPLTKDCATGSGVIIGGVATQTPCN